MPAWLDEMRRIFAASPFNRALGLELGDVGEGAAEITVALRPDHFNPLGIVHGGLIATGLDCALIQAVRSRCRPGDQQTTVEMKVNYLEAVRSSSVRFKGAVIRLGGRLCVAQADALDQAGLRVAVALGTIAVRRAPSTGSGA